MGNNEGELVHLGVHADDLLVGVDLDSESQQLLDGWSTALVGVGDCVLSGTDQLELSDDVLHGLFVKELLLLDSHNELGISALEV